MKNVFFAFETFHSDTRSQIHRCFRGGDWCGAGLVVNHVDFRLSLLVQCGKRDCCSVRVTTPGRSFVCTSWAVVLASNVNSFRVLSYAAVFMLVAFVHML